VPIHTLQQHFPNIHRHHEVIGGPWGKMEDLYDDGAMCLQALDEALGRIGIGRGPALLGLVADLFSNDVATVLAAVGEYLAFGWLSQHLGFAQDGIGYPANWAGQDAPFDGVLRDAASEIAFDVKDGSGSGLSLLQELLQRQVDQHAALGQVAPRVHVAPNAPTGQRWVNENFNAIVGQFREELRAKGLGPRKLIYPAGSGHVRVGIDRRVGASIVALHEKASFMARQTLAHAQHKARMLQGAGAESFFLAYVRRPGSGLSDFSSETVRATADFLSGRADLPNAFSGFLFLNFDRLTFGGAPEALCWCRDDKLNALCRAGAQQYVATPTATPEVRRATARNFNPGELEAAAAVMTGTCELRGVDCSAPGSAAPVFVFFHRGEQYVACQTCREQFGWPAVRAAIDETE
jgi:hypothetical protein